MHSSTALPNGTGFVLSESAVNVWRIGGGGICVIKKDTWNHWFGFDDLRLTYLHVIFLARFQMMLGVTNLLGVI